MRGVFYFYSMHSFISDVIRSLKLNNKNFSKLTFILPNKRSCLFFKNILIKELDPPVFFPEIIPVNSFIDELSNLNRLTPIECLFEFYEAYKSNVPINKREPFNLFSKWANKVLKDFDEIDKHLVQPEEVFKYLNAIQDINHWSLNSNPTKAITNHLKFWKDISIYYNSFSNRLLQNKNGSEGLIYKAAAKNIDFYISDNARDEHIFIGFNALFASEAAIIQKLLESGKALIYWDAEKSFLKSNHHDAGLFMRRYLNDWQFYISNQFNIIGNHYKASKTINIFGTSKQIAQVKYAGEIVKKLIKVNKDEKIALILPDETLLTPLLNSLPIELENINITMGLTLTNSPISSLIGSWFNLHKLSKKEFYHKDVFELLLDPLSSVILSSSRSEPVQDLVSKIKLKNLSKLDAEIISQICLRSKDVLGLLFNPCKGAIEALDRILKILGKLKNSFEIRGKENFILQEHIHRFIEIFQQLKNYNNAYGIIDSIKALQELYKELLNMEKIHFDGDSFKGLQIMGVLESRVLDYENVIILSLNEGVFPSGKKYNSFIPFDVRLENDLPTYKERDAIYTYHFYRLMHRAKNIYLLYNTEADNINSGEPSRFIAQLNLEKHHRINHQILMPNIPNTSTFLRKVKKTPQILNRLKEYANVGLSPSSLGQYIRNPIDFYNHRVLGIREEINLEETIEASTFGSVVHLTLKELYQPYQGKFLEISELSSIKARINTTINKSFQKIYRGGDITKGKNLISAEVAKRYVSNFINMEIGFLERGHKIKLESVEKEISISLEGTGFNFPVFLRGSVDRIDSFDGVRRIVDFKTSKVVQSDLNLIDWATLTTDYKSNNKIFQVLTYAYILNGISSINVPVEAGVISFKNLKEGFLKFTKKDKTMRGGNKLTKVSAEILANYEIQLKNLLHEIFSIDNDFLEKEI